MLNQMKASPSPIMQGTLCLARQWTRGHMLESDTYWSISDITVQLY